MKPIGYLTNTATWSNPDFNFIVGFGAKSDQKPNPNLKAIEGECVKRKLPFLVLFDFTADFYSDGQKIADPKFWPPVADDLPLQNLISIMANRDIRAVIVRVMTHINATTKKPEDAGYLSTAAQFFCGRVQDWLNAHKPNVPLIVETSNLFISAHAPNMNNWVGKYNTCAAEPAHLRLVEARPQEIDKPAYLDNRNTCEFWRYQEQGEDHALYIWRMETSLNDWLGFQSDTNPGTNDPGTGNPDLKTLIEKVTVLTDRLTVLEAKQAKLQTLLQKVEDAIDQVGL